MAWVYVILGGILEIGWVLGLKYSNGFTDPLLSVVTAISIVLSFVLFARSLTLLPIGTAYAVFTGIGAAGTAVIGMLFLDEPASVLRVLCLMLLIGGIIGLKIFGSETDAAAKAPAQQHGR